MKIAVLGTGMVGRTLAGKLLELGHEVHMGTRDPEALRSRDDEALSGWLAAHPDAGIEAFADAAAAGEWIVNATAGIASLDALESAGSGNLGGKILMDVANPLDFSGGMPPSLSVCNTDSLGEQIQRAFPDARVVKTLNTVNASVMVEPSAVPGDHVMFVSGNDSGAKSEVSALLTDGFGWPQILDLGDLTAARAQEMYLPLWLKMMGSLGTPTFNVGIAR